MTTEILKVDPKEFGLKESEAKSIELAFMPKIVERDGLKKVYEQLLTREITSELCYEAKSVRLKLVKVRTGIADIHKTQKAFFLAAGRYVDAWKNKETEPVLQMEEKLAEIEEYYENIERERIIKLQTERAIEIAKYQNETAFIPGNLGELTEEVWKNYLLGVKTAYEQKKAAEKAAEKAEEKRIAAEKAEQERIRKENEQLKVEVEKKQKEFEAERKKQEEILAKERAEAEAKQKAIEEKARIEREKAEAERKKLANQLQAKKDAELKEKQRIETEEKIRKENERKATMAPDKEKLINWINSLKISLPGQLKPESEKIANDIFSKFDSFKKWALNQIELL